MSEQKNVIITNDNLKVFIDTVVTRVNDNTNKKFNELKTDVDILKTDVAELKTDVAELKTDTKRIEKKVDIALDKQNKYDDTFHHIGKLANSI